MPKRSASGTSRRELSEDVPFGIGTNATIATIATIGAILLGCRAIEVGKSLQGCVVYTTCSSRVHVITRATEGYVRHERGCDVVGPAAH